MPSTASVTVQMEKILEEYSQKVQDVTERSMDETAKEAVSQLKATSPVGHTGKHPGRYARGWRFRKEDKMGGVIYNATDYQLTHLLENGHEVKPPPTRPGKKSRVAGTKHIKPVEEWCKTTFPIRISRGLK